MQTVNEILEAAQEKYGCAELSGDGMAVIAYGNSYPNSVVVISNPEYAGALGVAASTVLDLQDKEINGARIYKHYKKDIWLAIKSDWTSIFIHEPSESDIDG